MHTGRRATVLVLVACAVAAAMTPAYTAYKGHADDRDVSAVLAAYPALKGTPADSCATCHRSGEVNDPLNGGALRRENHCDYCHAVFVRGKKDVKATLNAFGAPYLAAGRDAAAIRALAGKDSDGDGFSNDVELHGGTNPGEAASNPDAAVAPFRTYTVAALRALAPVIQQTVFVNTTKSRSGDSYGVYRGQSAWAVLEAVGLAESAASVDFLAADGYEETFTVAELTRRWPQAAPVMGLGAAELGPCGWVRYAAPGLDAARPLPEASIMLAFEQDGRALPKAAPDAKTGRLVGTGPLRLIVPQSQVSPPDLPETAPAACAEKVGAALRFHDDYDHNGGKSTFAIVAVRVNPLPKGTRDVDWQTPALRHLADEQIVFFGALKPRGSSR
jgi:hypothetical protein